MRKIALLLIFFVSDLWACELARPVKFIPESEIANEILTRLNPQVNQKEPSALIYSDPSTHDRDPGQAWSRYPILVDPLTAYQSILRTIGPLLQNCEGQFNQLLNQINGQKQFLAGLERTKVKVYLYTNNPMLEPFVERTREILNAHENQGLIQLSPGDEVTRLQFRVKLGSKFKRAAIDYTDGQRNLGNFDINLNVVPDQYLTAGEVAALIATTIQEELPLHLKLSLYSIPTPNWLVQIGSLSSDTLIRTGNKIYLLIFFLIFFSLLSKWWHKRGAHLKEKTTK